MLSLLSILSISVSASSSELLVVFFLPLCVFLVLAAAALAGFLKDGLSSVFAAAFFLAGLDVDEAEVDAAFFLVVEPFPLLAEAGAAFSAALRAAAALLALW